MVPSRNLVIGYCGKFFERYPLYDAVPVRRDFVATLTSTSLPPVRHRICINLRNDSRQKWGEHVHPAACGVNCRLLGRVKATAQYTPLSRSKRSRPIHSTGQKRTTCPADEFWSVAQHVNWIRETMMTVISDSHRTLSGIHPVDNGAWTMKIHFYSSIMRSS